MTQFRVSVVLALAVLANNTIAIAAPVKKDHGSRATASKSVSAKEPEACKALAEEYENASKQLAKIYSEERGDNSAVMAQAQMTMTFLKNNGCKGPASAPNKDRYALAALNCAAAISTRDADERMARYNRQEPKPYYYPNECQLENWKPNN